MGTVVIDSTDLDAIAAEATGEPVPTEAPKTEAKPAETPEKPAEGTEVAPPIDPATDDVEGEDGLTPRQKRELTAKMQAAIGKKHRLLRDAEEFAAEQYNERRLAESRAEQQEREIQRLKAQLEGTQPVVEDSKPKRENFETEEAFRDAVDDWRVDQKFKAREAEERKAREAARQAEVLAAAKERITKAIELVPDYQEVTEAADIEVPPYIAGYMQESEMFAELGYHFAKHPEVLERLKSLNPARALVEVGKIESTLTPFAPSAKVSNGQSAESANGATPSPETGTPPSKPRATAPIKPLSSGSAVQVEKDEREKSTREVIADWSKAKHRNLMRRPRH